MPDTTAPFRDRLLLAILRISARLPLSWVRALGRVVGGVMAMLPTRARKTTETNLALCFPAMDAIKRRALVRQSLVETAITALEMGPMWFWSPEKLLARINSVHNEALYHEARVDPKGLMLIAPHLGNWELTGLYLAATAKLTVLYQPPRQPLLEAVILNARQRTRCVCVPTNRRGVLALLKALQAGEAIGILPDQEPEPESGVFAPFFGVPALTMTLASQLLAKTGARALMIVAWRNHEKGGFDLAFEPLPEGIYDADTACAVTAMNAGIEALVRQHPAQYQWEYKRFKKRPAGEPKVY